MKNIYKIMKECELFEQIEEINLKELLGCLGAKVLRYLMTGRGWPIIWRWREAVFQPK